MRYFILSDTHANFPSLDAVFKDMKKRFNPQFRKNSSQTSEDCLVNLGDSIGYMPYPNQCLAKLWKFASISTEGNHDKVARQLREGDLSADADFDDDPSQAIRWTAKHLSPHSLSLLNIIKDKVFFEQNNLIFAHSTPSYPEGMDYIQGRETAFDNFFRFSKFDGKIAFVGHIHVPQIYHLDKNIPVSDRTYGDIKGGKLDFIRFRPQKLKSGETFLPIGEFTDVYQLEKDTPFEKTWMLHPDWQVLVSVPSVGQPRDCFNYSGYTVYDSTTRALTIRRVPYDFSSVRIKMRELNFPKKLIDRLKKGK